MRGSILGSSNQWESISVCIEESTTYECISVYIETFRIKGHVYFSFLSELMLLDEPKVRW